MPTAKTQQILYLYRDLMKEVKLRMDVVVRLTDPAATVLPSQIVRETCYLQLRMVCELIALGCLVVHEDIPATKSPKVVKRYEADFIIKKLEELHPNFYPVPIRREQRGPASFQIIGADPTKALTKEDLINLYTYCGSVLHKGSIKKLLSAKSPIETKYEDIQRWREKVVRLLHEHYIFSLSGLNGFICLMANPDDGNVQVAHTEAVPPSE